MRKGKKTEALESPTPQAETVMMRLIPAFSIAEIALICASVINRGGETGLANGESDSRVDASARITASGAVLGAEEVELEVRPEKGV